MAPFLFTVGLVPGVGAREVLSAAAAAPIPGGGPVVFKGRAQALAGAFPFEAGAAGLYGTKTERTRERVSTTGRRHEFSYNGILSVGSGQGKVFQMTIPEEDGYKPCHCRMTCTLQGMSCYMHHGLSPMRQQQISYATSRRPMHSVLQPTCFLRRTEKIKRLSIQRQRTLVFGLAWSPWFLAKGMRTRIYELQAPRL
jgi:hypothetical protein